MITYVACDLFQSPARVLVNTVNTVGVMGKGIAKDFKFIYPDMFRKYQRMCEMGAFGIGDLWLHKTPNKWILNFPTKRHWRNPSEPQYIEDGLRKFAEMYHIYGITTISFPKLGCGNGELDWETQVQPLMESYLRGLPISAFIHLQERKDTSEPEHHDIRATKEWLRGEPESLAFSEVWDDLERVSDAPTAFAEPITGEPLSARVDLDSEAMTIHAPESNWVVPKDVFLELWQQIRQSGFVSGKDLPYGLDEFSEYVIPIIARLPYVELVTMADKYSEVGQQSVGLRLSPRPKGVELPLFAVSNVVEPA